MGKFYITTPLYYINDVPHIGHTCTTVAADIIARMHRQLGDEVFFLTGTDEHGQKVAEVAEKQGLKPQDYCDKISPIFKNSWKKLNISNDFFIRTTDIRHENIVKEVLQKIFDNGDIYKDKYEGYYCIGCESYLTEKELVDKHCPLHPPEQTEWRSEKNWFFKLSKYVPKIIKLIENDKTNYIFPTGKKSEILAKLKAGVRDISISRENVKWGITAPWDKKHTIYVWIEALLNYYTVTRFVEDKEKFWPANLHLLGKEILWFHTVIWQAMLMSAGIELPLKTFTHSFYMIDGNKMSKSKGNVISPSQLEELFGVDGTRYLIAHSFPSGNDSDVGIERFKETYNADLANNLGNLISRVNKLSGGFEKIKKDLKLENEVVKLIDQAKFNEAINIIFEKWVDKTNILLNKETPWKLEKDSKKRKEILQECISNIQKAICHLLPIMPGLSEDKSILFPRIV
jgi:methionyl-tRNA synthetase